MQTIHHAAERGHSQTDWLSSYHSFSFGEYYNPEKMGISLLRVINDDVIAPAGGFPTHGHKNMEIISYVLQGELEHKDSMGNGSIIRPGDVQRMSAGSGIHHSEFNPSETNPMRLLQIWLLPDTQNIQPEYAQQHFNTADRQAQLKLLASPDGRNNSLAIHSDTLMYGALLQNRESAIYNIRKDRLVYLHIAKGSVDLNQTTLQEGDAATVEAGSRIHLTGLSDADILLFDLPNTI